MSPVISMHFGLNQECRGTSKVETSSRTPNYAAILIFINDIPSVCVVWVPDKGIPAREKCTTDTN